MLNIFFTFASNSNLKIMKITTYLSLLFIAITLTTSCKKDEVTPTHTPTTDNTLTGNWQLEQLFIANIEATDDCSKKTTYNIKEDKTYININYNLKNDVCEKSESKGTWETDGNNLIITDEEKHKLTMKYSIKDGKLTLEGEVNSISHKIVFKKS